MTICAVRKYKDKIVIASDSQSTWGDNKKLDFIKILKGENFIVGCSGSGFDAALFRAYLRTHKLNSATEDDVIYLLSEFIDWKNKRTGNPDFRLQLLFVMEGKIFESYGCSVTECNKEFAAIGCGMFLALGAMELDADPIKAVEIAIKHDLYCGGEITSLEIPNAN